MNSMRIGALSRRTGVSPDVLRVWERRYRVLRPSRTEGGFRLYSEEDARRVEAMKRLTASGMRAGDAAQEVLAERPGVTVEGGQPLLESARDRLWVAVTNLDEAGLQGALDEVLSTFDLDTAIRDVLLPALKRLGEEWAEGTVSVGQEHFAVNILRGRLMGMARGWDRGFGPRVLLACPEGELHDISLVMFGLAMHRRGWRVTFLGANTPTGTLETVAAGVGARLTVLYATDWSERGTDLGQSLIAAGRELALAGRGCPGAAEGMGARALEGDPVWAAEELTREVARAS